MLGVMVESIPGWIRSGSAGMVVVISSPGILFDIAFCCLLSFLLSGPVFCLLLVGMGSGLCGCTGDNRVIGESH